MWRCQIIDRAKTILLADVGWLDARLLAYLAPHGLERVRLHGHIEIAFKKAADDGADGECVAQFLAGAVLEELQDAGGCVFFVAGVAKGEV